MKYLTILICMIVTGCSTVNVPITQTFPDAPTVLFQACPQLQTIDGTTTTLSKLTETVAGNYTTYYDCSVKVDGWIEWYNTQKIIFNRATK